MREKRMGIYQELGIKKVVNAWGTVTKLGGSLMSPEVLEAMREAAGSFVSMEELHEKAGRRIAELLNVEAACVTCGAAAGLAVATAACMTGLRKSFAYQLPDTTGMKDEILVLKCHRDLYDQSMLLTGAKFVEVGVTSYAFAQQIEDKISDRTAAFFFTCEAETMRGSIPFEEIAAVCKAHGVPIIVDAAAELPPKKNIRRYLDMGASFVVFSGGKELRGPQASGLILGTKEGIEACDLNCCPNYGIGRAMKVDKENICGLVKAVEIFAGKDYDRQMKIWEGYTHQLEKMLSSCAAIQICTGYPHEPGVQPACILRLFVKPLTMTAPELFDRLTALNPSVYTFLYQDKVVLNPQCLEEDELQYVADAILSVVSEQK